MPRVLKDIKIHEVSGVDRGAGEGVRVVLMKRLDTTEQETDMTPEQIAKLISDGVTAGLAKALPEALKAGTADITKALADAQAELAVLKMSADEKDHCDKQGMDDAARKAFAAKSPEDRKAAMTKAADKDKLPPEITKALEGANGDLKKANDTIADMQKRLAAHDEREAKATFEKRATDLGLKAEDGEIMRKAYGGDAGAQTELDKRIAAMAKSLKTAQDSSGIFREFGKQGEDGTGGDAYAKLTQKADELRKADTKLSPEQAFTKVYTDPANAEIAMQYRKEDAERRRSRIAVA
jgi:hypothetical protein